MSSLFYMHPKLEADFRSQKPAVAGTFNYKCKRCKQHQFSMAGRKKGAMGGWICPTCQEKR